MSLANRAQGFTLIELVAVLILVAIMAASVGSRLVSQSTFTLMASRDLLVSAFSSAQQLAMARNLPVRFSTRFNQLNILIDTNNDGSFADESSVRIDGVQYPIALNTGQSISSLDFDFNRLGRSDAGSITLSEGASNVIVSVSSVGNIQ